MVLEQDYKKYFFYGDKNVICFDNSSTSKKLKKAIDMSNTYYEKNCTNIGRANNKFEYQNTKKVEEIRGKVADFLGVSKEEIFYSFGSTHSANLIAYSYGLQNLNDGDNILFCSNDHKSTTKPFEHIVNILKGFNKNIDIRNFTINNDGKYEENEIIKNIDDNTKMIILTHLHNKNGTEMNISDIVKKIKEKNSNTKIVLDITQSIGHIDVNLKDLNVDFAFFSGHKCFAETGIGITFIKKDIQDYMIEFLDGSGNNKFEKGTQNIAGIISLGESISFFEEIGIKNVEEYIEKITKYLITELSKNNKVIFDKNAQNNKCGIVTFEIENMDSDEVSAILADYNILVRTGNFCIRNSEENKIRVSLHIYNSIEEIDRFIKVLDKITM